MRAKCPKCKTSYDLKPLAAKGVKSVIICAVCQSHLEVKPRSWKSLFFRKIIIRQEEK